jgi:hypothetical protein
MNEPENDKNCPYAVCSRKPPCDSNDNGPRNAPRGGARLCRSHLFSFRCFEGTSGEGRVHPDGSIAGVVRFRDSELARYVTLPPGALRVTGETICALVNGMPSELCFDLYRTDAKSFRGSLAGMNFASCQFTGRADPVQMVGTPLPLSIQPTVAASSRQ